MGRRWRGWAAVAAFALSGGLPVPAAAGSAGCMYVAGVASAPGWTLRYQPGLTLTPAIQRVAIDPVGIVPVMVTCRAAGFESSFTALFEFYGSADGASTVPESLASGAGRITGLHVAPWAVADGGYPYVDADVSVTYQRTGTALTLVVTLGGLSVDEDAWGPRPLRFWGDVSFTAAAPTDTGSLHAATGSGLAQDRVTEVVVAPAVGIAAKGGLPVP